MTTINIVGNGLSGSSGSGGFSGATVFTSWTPVFTFATPGNLSVSYATQSGNYEISGNIYVATFNLVCTPTFTTASGNLSITGLPAASNATAGNIAVGNVYTGTMTWPTLATSLSCTIAAGASAIQIVGSGTAQSSAIFASTNFTTGVQIQFVGTITYLV